MAESNLSLNKKIYLPNINILPQNPINTYKLTPKHIPKIDPPSWEADYSNMHYVSTRNNILSREPNAAIIKSYSSKSISNQQAISTPSSLVTTHSSNLMFENRKSSCYHLEPNPAFRTNSTTARQPATPNPQKHNERAISNCKRVSKISQECPVVSMKAFQPSWMNAKTVDELMYSCFCDDIGECLCKRKNSAKDSLRLTILPSNKCIKFNVDVSNRNPLKNSFPKLDTKKRFVFVKESNPSRLANIS